MSVKTIPNRVDCTCDPGFHRSVMYFPGPEGPFACLHCGACTFSQVIGDDGRGGGKAWQDTIVMDVSAELVAWVSRLPRRAGTWGETPESFLPANARFSSVSALEAAELEREAETAGWSEAQKIRAAGIPGDPPPPELSKINPYYTYAWEALQMDESTSIEDLLRMAQRSDYLLELTMDLFFEKENLHELMAGWLQSFENDLYWYTRSSGDAYFVATSLMMWQEEMSPEHVDILLRYLQRVSLNKSPYYPDELQAAYRIDAALEVLEKWGLTPEVVQTLEGLKNRIKKPEIRTYRQLSELLRHV